MHGHDRAKPTIPHQENDYFGTLATVLDLVSQDLRTKGTPATQRLSCVSETG
jgi:hypothetical protein